uniref:Hexosyltransferase n=1 Tax=Panagrolaimus superbus TaxID=310955 RepID=A0A914Z7F4_9BILA
MGIRSSWKKDVQLNSNFTHKFFIGWTWNETLRKTLKEESQKYGDIIFTNIVDDYSNLTLKMNSIFQWQQNFCQNVDFILRADEDTVLDISRFEYWMNNEIKDLIENIGDEMILGHLIENSPTVRQSCSKWYKFFLF